MVWFVCCFVDDGGGCCVGLFVEGVLYVLCECFVFVEFDFVVKLVDFWLDYDDCGFFGDGVCFCVVDDVVDCVG